MSYRYDKKKKQKRIAYGIGIALCVLVLFTPVYSFLFRYVQEPVLRSWKNKNDVYARTDNIFQSFFSKTDILEQQKELQQKTKD